MGSYKKYTDEFKRDVLAMVAEGTRSIARIERDLDLTPGLGLQMAAALSGAGDELAVERSTGRASGTATVEARVGDRLNRSGIS